MLVEHPHASVARVRARVRCRVSKGKGLVRVRG